MSNGYKPILICNGDEKHLREDGELTCGGCGYIFDSRSTEDFFRNIEIDPEHTKVYSPPLYCECCCKEFEKIHFSELGETLFVVPRSKFKKRYVTGYGELILPNEHSDAEFVPSWEPSKRRKMAYIDSIAYMLYSSNIKSDDLQMLIDHDGCALYNGGTSLDGLIYRDIIYVSRLTFRQYASQFDILLDTMRGMENDRFFSIGGNKDD